MALKKWRQSNSLVSSKGLPVRKKTRRQLFSTTVTSTSVSAFWAAAFSETYKDTVWFLMIFDDFFWEIKASTASSRCVFRSLVSLNKPDTLCFLLSLTWCIMWLFLRCCTFCVRTYENKDFLSLLSQFLRIFYPTGLV